MKPDHSRTTPRRWRLSWLAASIALAGCAHGPDRSALFDGRQVRAETATIGDLAPRQVVIRPQALKPVPPEEVLATYRKALALFSTADQRSAAMRRMADLTMIASEDTLGSGLSDEALPGADALKGGDPQYQKAIALYLDQIASAPAGTDLSDTLYLLAKAYDLNAEPEKALETLDRLARDYPGSKVRDEVEFRRGEQYFSLARYDEAATAYRAVVTVGERSGFYENALYKLGWSLYKQGQYEASIEPFLGLLDRFLPAPPPPPKAPVTPAQAQRLAEISPKPNRPQDAAPVLPPTTRVMEEDSAPKTPREKARRQMEDDTLRAVALAFSNLDGPSSVSRYLRTQGTRHYAYRLYESLAGLYLYQERYRDAADAYGAYIDQYPFHPLAPRLTSKKIEVYTKGGFPTLVLQEKRNFIQQYGVFSHYWKRATPQIRESYQADLKRHTLELAQHFHANAQQSKAPADYKQAARWYREYLAAFPKDEAVPMMNGLLGEVLFASEDFAKAIEEFERTAYGYSAHEGAQKAGYFSLLAYQEYLKRMPRNAPGREAWVMREITATLRFAKTWPNDTHITALYENVMDNQLAMDDLKGAEATAAAIIKRVPPVPPPLLEKAWMVQANAQFDQRNFVAAERSIKTVLGFASLTAAERALFAERRAQAIYKQAEVLEQEGMKDKAAEVFLRAARTQPDAEVGAKAEYDAATLLMDTGKYRDAIRVLEGFREKYPEHSLAATVPAKLSLAYEKIGDSEGSARELERIAAADPGNAELGMQALTQAASLHEKNGNRPEAIRLYTQLEASESTSFAQRVEYRYKLATLHEANRDLQARDRWLLSIIDAWESGGTANTPRTRFLAAEASFRTTEPMFEQYVAMPLTQPLGDAIKRKKAAMATVTEAYKRTADIGVLQYTTAANYKLGEIYRAFSRAIMDSERPGDMSEDALAEYELLLEDQAMPLDDKAIAIHETNVRRVQDGVWNEWITRSFAALADLQPGRYRKPELVEEVTDDIL